MPRAYSSDMRARVIARVESGASRREAADHYEVSASTAVIWVKCFYETGRCAAQPRGGSTSPLEQHAEFLLALIDARPDLTLDEVVSAMRKHRVAGSRTAVWRFFQRHKITFKKSLRAAEQERPDVARARRRITGCLLKPFCTDIAPAHLGAIFPSVLATGRSSTSASADGRRAEFSNAFSSCWRVITTTNT